MLLGAMVAWAGAPASAAAGSARSLAARGLDSPPVYSMRPSTDSAEEFAEEMQSLRCTTASRRITISRRGAVAENPRAGRDGVRAVSPPACPARS